MIIRDDINQGSDEWFRLHAGIPGASTFNKIVTSTGKPSQQRQDYIYELAGQRLTGTYENGYQSHAMLRGLELEAEARAYYEFLTGETVRQVAFVYKDENKNVGCSPDGLIKHFITNTASGTNENFPAVPPIEFYTGLEIKCPLMKTHVKYLLNGKLPSEYFIQVHGSMWVCNFTKWIFMSYHPELPPLIIEISRDYKFTSALEYELERFIEELDAIYKELQRKTS